MSHISGKHVVLARFSLTRNMQLWVLVFLTLLASACESHLVQQIPSTAIPRPNIRGRLGMLRLRGGHGERDYYEVLGLSRDCSPDDVRKAYRFEQFRHVNCFVCM